MLVVGPGWKAEGKPAVAVEVACMELILAGVMILSTLLALFQTSYFFVDRLLGQGKMWVHSEVVLGPAVYRETLTVW